MKNRWNSGSADIMGDIERAADVVRNAIGDTEMLLCQKCFCYSSTENTHCINCGEELKK